MQHFCRSMTVYKNTPIFTSWLIIKVYIMTCSAVSFIWCCICMYQAQFIEGHKGYILYNCTSRWSSRWTAPQFTITPKAEIKSKCEQKTSVTITCYDHFFSIIPRKSILTKDDSFCLSLIFYCPASCLIICPKFPPPSLSLSLSLQWHHFMSCI